MKWHSVDNRHGRETINIPESSDGKREETIKHQLQENGKIVRKRKRPTCKLQFRANAMQTIKKHKSFPRNKEQITEL